MVQKLCIGFFKQCNGIFNEAFQNLHIHIVQLLDVQTPLSLFVFSQTFKPKGFMRQITSQVKR